jgi:hypothetical protein
MGAHGALAAGCVLWSIHHPASPSGAVGPTEFEVRTLPPPVTVSTPLPPRVVPGPPAPGSRRPARGLNLGPAAPVPVSFEDASFVAPRIGDPEGDEDQTFDSPSPSTLGAGTGAVSGTGPVPAQTIEKPIAPLEAAYLCTYQSLRSLPRPLYVRGRSYKLVVRMCINDEGRVSDVTLQRGAAPELDAQVVTDMHAWRYRPRIVHGKPAGFCYKVNVTYDVD